MQNDTWQLQEAKAKFNLLVDKCQHTPQRVTHNGVEAAYIISAADYYAWMPQKNSSPTTVGQFLRSSPLFASGIELDISRPRADGSHRDVVFDNEA